MSRRDQITMSPSEAEDFLAAQRVVVCATAGPRGWPHLMPLWYVVRGAELWAWTYAKAQKVRNLERDARATLVVEDGHEYHELRGVMIEAETELHRDPDVVAGIGAELAERYGGTRPDESALAAARAQAAKRVALQFRPRRTASWDHRKLGGTY